MNISSNTTILPCETVNSVGPGLLVLNIGGLIYSFIMIAIICDEYFVPALELITLMWKITPDIAGATLMAAGGSAPELFTSYVGTFKRSTIGADTIVGSAVFNVLFVIALCIIFQKHEMQLTAWPLFRDCTYYILSLIILYISFEVNSPGKIDIYESAILLGMYILYVIIMKYNEKIYHLLYEFKIIYIEKQINYERPITFRAGILKLLTRNTLYEEGVSVSIIAELAGNIEETFQAIDTNKNGTIEQNELKQVLDKLGSTISEEETNELFQMIDTDNNGRINMEEFRKWYTTSEIRLETKIKKIFQQISQDNEDHITQNQFQSFMIEHNISKLNIDLELAFETNKSLSFNQFYVWYKESILWDKDITLHNAEVVDSEGIHLSFPQDESNCNKIMWFITIPIMIVLYSTIPDVRKPTISKYSALAYLAFILSIGWIGLATYFMVSFAEVIGATIQIPINIMGIVVLAAGTSVPDMLSSIIVARQGKADMAISSSIGSNIFDILVGLPLPWMSFSIYYSEAVSIATDNIALSILILIFMVAIVVASIHYYHWETDPHIAKIMIIFYVLFLVQALARSDWSC